MTGLLTIPRLFGRFGSRVAEVRTWADQEQLLLDVHQATANHHAEARWLQLSSDPAFASMSSAEIDQRLKQELTKLLELVGKLHLKHGVFDVVFNQRCATLITDTFWDRVRAVSSIDLRGRA